MSNISDKDTLEFIVQEYTKILKSIWYQYLQWVNITK